MDGSACHIPCLGCLFATTGADFPLDGAKLEKSVTYLQLAGRHYRIAKEHFPASSPTFAHRVADILHAWRRNRFAGRRFLRGNA